MGDYVVGRPRSHPGQQRRCHRQPALLPATQLPLDESVGAPEIGDAGFFGIEQVQVRERVNDGEADPPGRVRVTGHARRDAAPDHSSGAVLDDEEVRTCHFVVRAEKIGARGAVIVPPQPGKRSELALHVVRPDGNLPEGRAADDQAPVGELEQVREVRGAVQELSHADLRPEAVDIRPQIVRQPIPVQFVARPDRAVLGRIVRSHESVASGFTF